MARERVRARAAVCEWIACLNVDMTQSVATYEVFRGPARTTLWEAHWLQRCGSSPGKCDSCECGSNAGEGSTDGDNVEDMVDCAAIAIGLSSESHTYYTLAYPPPPPLPTTSVACSDAAYCVTLPPPSSHAASLTPVRVVRVGPEDCLCACLVTPNLLAHGARDGNLRLTALNLPHNITDLLAPAASPTPSHLASHPPRHPSSSSQTSMPSSQSRIGHRTPPSAQHATQPPSSPSRQPSPRAGGPKRFVWMHRDEALVGVCAAGAPVCSVCAVSYGRRIASATMVGTVSLWAVADTRRPLWETQFCAVRTRTLLHVGCVSVSWHNQCYSRVTGSPPYLGPNAVRVVLYSPQHPQRLLLVRIGRHALFGCSFLHSLGLPWGEGAPTAVILDLMTGRLIGTLKGPSSSPQPLPPPPPPPHATPQHATPQSGLIYPRDISPPSGRHRQPSATSHMVSGRSTDLRNVAEAAGTPIHVSTRPSSAPSLRLPLDSALCGDSGGGHAGLGCLCCPLAMPEERWGQAFWWPRQQRCLATHVSIAQSTPPPTVDPSPVWRWPEAAIWGGTRDGMLLRWAVD